MARMLHGETVSLDDVRKAHAEIQAINNRLGLASAPVKIFPALAPFKYMFEDLQSDPEALLPAGEKTVQGLIDLGKAMNEPGDDPKFDSAIPSAYTYFGQFLAHDLTLELQSDEITRLGREDVDPLSLEPLPPDVVRNEIKNSRTPVIDLDSVYGATSDGTPVPRICESLVVGMVVSDSDDPAAGPRPPHKDAGNDLPRKPRSKEFPEIDREAQIGDGRNDENLITAQMHLAFLRAHNALVERGLTFREARKTLTQLFQWLILTDYLPKLVRPDVINDILVYGNRFYRPPLCRRYVPLRPPACATYVPLEFSAAAFRFGHSMVRSSYNYNSNFNHASGSPATLKQIFALSAFSGGLADFDRLPEKWIIEWDNFVAGDEVTPNVARRIGPRLVEPLFALTDTVGRDMGGVRGSLAVRNLLRGYLLRLPTGQSVAKVIGVENPLTPKRIEAAAKDVNPKQFDALKESGLLERTPLWYYILAEAADGGSDLLGPVGGTIVAEVLIGLIRWSEDSILSEPGWRPALGEPFTLRDLFKLAGVWA